MSKYDELPGVLGWQGVIEQDYDQHYYVTKDGHAITEPMRAADIVAKFGPVRQLEADGFRVVRC